MLGIEERTGERTAEHRANARKHPANRRRTCGGRREEVRRKNGILDGKSTGESKANARRMMQKRITGNPQRVALADRCGPHTESTKAVHNLLHYQTIAKRTDHRIIVSLHCKRYDIFHR